MFDAAEYLNIIVYIVQLDVLVVFRVQNEL